MEDIKSGNTSEAVPENERQPWHIPAIIFGGLEFCIPVLMVGGILIGNFSLYEVIGILLIGLCFFQWIGNAVQGYIGAKTGLSSTALASLSFGTRQAKIVVGIVILVLTLGWWAIQTAVASDALCALLEINRGERPFLYVLCTFFIGIFFAIPSILGYASIKWVDFIAMPAGLVLVAVAIYLSVQNFGMDNLLNYQPEGSMSFIEAINLVISINVAQWLIAPDYTRFAKPRWKDNILIPLGIIVVGFPLFIVGGIMSIGTGNADIVLVMQNLGFPAWGFVVLWIATWTSQLVSNYTGGLVLCTIFNTHGDKERKGLTLLFALIGIVLALMGIMNQFVNFLYLTALVVPVIAGIIMAHFFFRDKLSLNFNKSWNWTATFNMLLGLIVGYVTQYIYPIGIPAVLSLLVSGMSYVLISAKRPLV